MNLILVYAEHIYTHEKTVFNILWAQMDYRAPPGPSMSLEGLPCTTGPSIEGLPCTLRALHRGVTVHPQSSPRRGYRAPPGLSTEGLSCTPMALQGEVTVHPPGSSTQRFLRTQRVFHRRVTVHPRALREPRGVTLRPRALVSPGGLPCTTGPSTDRLLCTPRALVHEPRGVTVHPRALHEPR